MKKIVNTSFFLLISLMSFAQQERPEREGRFPSSDGAEDLADSFGGPGVAVDSYILLLLLVAVSMITFFVYKKFQSRQA